MKHFSSYLWRNTSLVTLFFLLAAGLPVRAQQTEAAQQAAQLALQTSAQWAGSDIPPAAFRISGARLESSGLLYGYSQQLQAGIPVYNRVATLVFKNGKLSHHAGTFLPVKAFVGQPATPTQQTFAPAGMAHRPIEARLVWATDKGTPRLAWNVNVELLATPDWLNIRIDATTGKSEPGSAGTTSAERREKNPGGDTS
uniref:FTP domain-containing protein n=1 Tax=Tanacetum cinerariifolium TaxID=118510 RepID=A0A699QNW9_TANCI|nr:hypothetical protein [Tanacetum cinerariifolium]